MLMPDVGDFQLPSMMLYGILNMRDALGQVHGIYQCQKHMGEFILVQRTACRSQGRKVGPLVAVEDDKFFKAIFG